MTDSSAAPKAISSMSPGEIYLCVVPSLSDTGAPLSCVCSNYPDTVVIAQLPQQNYFATQTPELQTQLHKVLTRQCQAVWFWQEKKPDKPRNFFALLRDAQRTHPKRGSLLLLIVEEAAIGAPSFNKLQSHLERWRQWAATRQLRVLFLVTGQHSELRPLLMRSHNVVAGLSSLHVLGSASWSYHLHYWRNSLGVMADYEYLIELENGNKLAFTPVSRSEQGEAREDRPHTGADDDSIYVCAAALTGKDQDALKKDFTLVASDNHALMQSLDNVHTATVIFSCSTAHEIRELGLYCYQLRQQFGAGLKILIREVSQCLRYTDEQLLLKSGASLILPHALNHSMMMTQVAALKGQWFYRALPPRLGDLLTNWDSIALQGYYEPGEFSRHARRIFTLSRKENTDSVLVALTPSFRIPAQHCLTLCDIRRDGDLITLAANKLYILFRACRPVDAKAALEKCFSLPPEEIFDVHEVIHETGAIDNTLSRIAELHSEIDTATGQDLLRHSPARSGNVQSQQASESGGEIALATRKPLALASGDQDEY